MDTIAPLTRSPCGKVRGFTLVDVALSLAMIMSISMALIKLEITLQRDYLLAWQRSAALRTAQTQLARIRLDLVGDGTVQERSGEQPADISPGLSGPAEEALVRWNVRAFGLDGELATMTVGVYWRDRLGTPQELILVSRALVTHK